MEFRNKNRAANNQSTKDLSRLKINVIKESDHEKITNHNNFFVNTVSYTLKQHQLPNDNIYTSTSKNIPKI